MRTNAMKLGYPCINHSIHCSTNHTFQLASYSEEKLIATVTHNLENLLQILKFNVQLLLDTFHHQCLHNSESLRDALKLCFATWQKKDGIPMVDYSTQQKGGRRGKHSDHINLSDFKIFINETKGVNYDLMLEIKDKEKSALKAAQLIFE